MTTEADMIWLVAEDEDNDFILLKRACLQLTPTPSVRRAKDGSEAQELFGGSWEICRSQLLPAAGPDTVRFEDASTRRIWPAGVGQKSAIARQNSICRSNLISF